MKRKIRIKDRNKKSILRNPWFQFLSSVQYSKFYCPNVRHSLLFFSVSLCFSLLPLGFSLKPNAESRMPERPLTMKKPNPFQHTASKVFSINPGTAGLFRTVGCTYFVSAVHRERTVFCTLFRSHSRSGRRGRMHRHMRDNMASRGRDTGKSRPEGGHSPLFHIVWDDVLCSLSMCKKRGKDFLPRICPPLSSPGVCGSNPPEKPTDVFYRLNRQWCGARRGGGEGSPRARVSFEQHRHRRAASSTARTRASWIMDLLDMIKRCYFHIHEDQQNMGTGNAALSRCLYPFLRPLDFFNSPTKPLCKTVRAGGVREMIRFMNSKEMPFRCRAGTPAGTARFFTFSAAYYNENLVTF